MSKIFPMHSTEGFDGNNLPIIRRNQIKIYSSWRGPSHAQISREQTDGRHWQGCFLNGQQADGLTHTRTQGERRRSPPQGQITSSQDPGVWWLEQQGGCSRAGQSATPACHPSRSSPVTSSRPRETQYDNQTTVSKDVATSLSRPKNLNKQESS